MKENGGRGAGCGARMIRSAVVFLAVILVWPNICQPGVPFLPFLKKGGESTVSYAGIDDHGVLPLWPHERSDIAADPATVYGKLPNGFRYVLLQNNEPENRVSMHLFIHAGSLAENEEELGTAHFLEHMMFNGTTHFDPGELVAFFQRIGMQFGPDANAHTGFDETVYDILLPSGSNKSIDEGLQVFDDYARGALLLDEEIDRERKVVLAEKRTRDSASYRTFVSSMKFEYPQMRISRRFPIGTVETLKNADRSVLKGFYDAWYRPERMILVMVGRFDLDAAQSLIRKRFSDMVARVPGRDGFDLGKIQHKGLKTFWHFEASAGQASVTLENLRKIRWNGDSIDFQRKMLLRSLAHQIVQNRLNAIISKKAAPFTSAWIGSGTFLKEIHIARLTAECSSVKWEETLGFIEKTMRSARSFGFFQSELDRVKKTYLAMLDNAVKSADTRDSSEIARQIIRQVGDDTVFQSPRQEKALLSPIIEQVSLEEINNAFRDAWPDDHRLVLVTGNVPMSQSEAPPEKVIAEIYEKSRHTPVIKPSQAQASVFPYLPVPDQSGRIADKEEVAADGIIRIVFENGVRLNLKKSGFKRNQVLASLSFGNGKSEEPAGKPGLATLSASVFNESGVGGLTNDELDTALAGKNTSVKLDIREDAFILDGRSVTEELELLFQLFYSYLKDPAIRPEAFDLAMARFDQEYTTLSREVDGALKLSVHRYLAGGDSRFGLPSRERFKTLSSADVRQFIFHALQNSPLELSIVGDFSEDQVISLASRYFGTLTARSRVAPDSRPGTPVFPEGGFRRIEVPTKIPKALVVVAYPTEDFWDIERTRRLNILADLFSEQLRVVIREKLGAAYSPFAFNRPSRAYDRYGVFQILVFVAPEQAELVAGEIRKIALKMAVDGVSDDALARALEPALTGIRDMRRNNAYWLNSVLTGVGRHPEQLEWSRTILKDYAAITADDIARLAKQYLVDEKAATVIITPEN